MHSKEGTLPAGIVEKSLHFGAATHVARRAVPGRAPAVFGLVHESSRRLTTQAAVVEWSFARATTERSVAEKVADGVAPHSGADHARDDRIGSAQAGSACSNADRGSNLARRRIRGSYGCARASFRNGRNRMFGLRPPRCDELEGLTARRRARAGAQPPREHLARTLQGVSTSSRRRTKPSATRRRTSAIDEVRDGYPARGAHSARRAALESTPVEDVSGDESLRVRFTAARVEVASAGQANARSAARPRARAGTATETSEVKIATRRTSEYLVSARAVPPKRAWSA